MIKPSSSFNEGSYGRVAKKVERGDLIEVKRGNYSHWLICESVESDGTVWCFHVSSEYGSSSFSGRPTEDVIIKYQKLEDVLKDTDDGKPSPFRVDNQKSMAEMHLKGRECPDLDAVFSQLHEKKGSKVEYDWKRLNCEHYCTEWKYGIGWSSQVDDFHDATDWAVIGSTCAVAALGLVLVGYTLRKRN